MTNEAYWIALTYFLALMLVIGINATIVERHLNRIDKKIDDLKPQPHHEPGLKP